MKSSNNKNTQKRAKQRQNLLKIVAICAVMVAISLISQSVQNLQICVFVLTKQIQCAIIAEFSKKGK